MSYVYPWLDCFAKNYATLKTIGPQIPTTLRAAYQSLLKSGATIQATLDSGATVASDDAKQWLSTAQQFATHLKGSLTTQAQSIAQCSTEGIATADDSIVQPLDTARLWLASELQAAHDELQGLLTGASSSPWTWIVVGLVAVFVLPGLLDEGPAPRRRKAKAAAA